MFAFADLIINPGGKNPLGISFLHPISESSTFPCWRGVPISRLSRWVPGCVHLCVAPLSGWYHSEMEPPGPLWKAQVQTSPAQEGWLRRLREPPCHPPLSLVDLSLKQCSEPWSNCIAVSPSRSPRASGHCSSQVHQTAPHVALGDFFPLLQRAGWMCWIRMSHGGLIKFHFCGLPLFSELSKPVQEGFQRQHLLCPHQCT